MASKINKTNITIKKDLNNEFDPKNNDNEDLDTKAKNEEKKQTINEKRFIFWVKMISMGICSIILICSFALYMIQLLVPEHCKWIPENSINKLESIAIAVGSGVLSSMITSYFFNSKK